MAAGMNEQLGTDACAHCWHDHKGPIMMVIKDGHVVESCCKCRAVRQVHAEHRDADRITRGYRRW